MNPKAKSDFREVQIWEDVCGSTETFYGHALVSVDLQVVNHLDCATINFSEEEKRNLFERAHKVKGRAYKKHFRIDGSFPLTTAIDLMRAYFPIKELANEALNISGF